MVEGQELGYGPGGAGRGALFSLAQLNALVDGVHQEEERLLGRLGAQEGEEDTPERGTGSGGKKEGGEGERERETEKGQKREKCLV